MRQAITKVYSFNELPEDAKQKAIDYFRENDDMPFLSDDLAYHLEETLKHHGIKYDELPKIYYSLSYSQGDGAMFEGTVYWKAYTADIKQSGHYYHFNSKLIDLYSTKTGNYPKDAVYNEFEALYVDICKDLEQYGYGCIEAQQSDENISEMIEANNYEFTEDGKLW